MKIPYSISPRYVTAKWKFKRLLQRNRTWEGTLNQRMRALLPSHEVRRFYEVHMQYPIEIQKIINSRTPRFDRYLLQRRPRLYFNKNGNEEQKVDISQIYTSHEVRDDQIAYDELAKLIMGLKSFIKFESILELGCTSGNLIFGLHKLDPCLQLQGIEGFDFLKAAAHESIRNKIKIHDLREPILHLESADLLICLEVGEHIDPAAIEIFFRNLNALSRKYLLISWSDSYPRPDAPPQHLSPLRKKELRKILQNYGFQREKNLTRVALLASIELKNFHPWWRDSMQIWKKVTGDEAED